MAMVPVKCTSCGGEIQLDDQKESGFCLHCGTKVIFKEAVSKVNVDQSHLIGNYLMMANTAYEADNKKEAETYCNKIIENDAQNYEAWFLKGKAAGWQSTLANIRFQESVNCWANAIKFAPEKNKETLEEDIKNEIHSLSIALIRLRSGNFEKFPDEAEANGFMNDISAIYSAIITLKDKSDLLVNIDSITEEIATIINGSVTVAFNKIQADYSGDDGRPSKYEFEQYIERIGYCTILIEKAIGLNENDGQSDIQRYKNLIFFHEIAIAACSWDYNFTDSGDKSYFKKYTLNDEAIAYRRKIIMECHEKIKSIDPNYVIPTAKTSGGCYIATAVYGSYEAPEVIVLRKFRDEVIRQSLLGRVFIKVYSILSPPVANWLKNAKMINRVVKALLDRWANMLQKQGD